MKKSITLIMLAVYLSGCASNPAAPKLTLASSLFVCNEEPPIPPEDMSDTDLALFVVRLQNAGEDCRNQLAEVRHMLEVSPQVEVTDVLVVGEEKPKKLLGIF